MQRSAYSFVQKSIFGTKSSIYKSKRGMSYYKKNHEQELQTRRLFAIKKIFSLEEMARLYDSLNPTLNTKIGEDNQKQESASEFNDGELYYEQSIQCEKRTD